MRPRNAFVPQAIFLSECSIASFHLCPRHGMWLGQFQFQSNPDADSNAGNYTITYSSFNIRVLHQRLHQLRGRRMPQSRAALLIHQACRLWAQWLLIWSVAEVIFLPSCKPPQMLRAVSASITSPLSLPAAQAMQSWWQRARHMILEQPRDRLGVFMLRHCWFPAAGHLSPAIRSFRAQTSARFSYASRRRATLREAQLRRTPRKKCLSRFTSSWPQCESSLWTLSLTIPG